MLQLQLFLFVMLFDVYTFWQALKIYLKCTPSFCIVFILFFFNFCSMTNPRNNKHKTIHLTPELRRYLKIWNQIVKRASNNFEAWRNMSKCTTWYPPPLIDSNLCGNPRPGRVCLSGWCTRFSTRCAGGCRFFFVFDVLLNGRGVGSGCGSDMPLAMPATTSPPPAHTATSSI